MPLTITHDEKLRFKAESGKHSIVIDLPEAAGGTDAGFSPPQMFIASLGSCIGVYVVDYCERAGIVCKGMKVHLDWKMAEDPKRISDIRVQIDLPAAIPAAREKAILAVAEHCLVHNTILHTPEVAIQLNHN